MSAELAHLLSPPRLFPRPARPGRSGRQGVAPASAVESRVVQPSDCLTQISHRVRCRSCWCVRFKCWYIAGAYRFPPLFGEETADRFLRILVGEPAKLSFLDFEWWFDEFVPYGFHARSRFQRDTQ